MADTLSATPPRTSLWTRRRQTILGLTIGLVFVVGVLFGDKDETPRALATLLMLLPLLYLVVATLGRQQWTWPVLYASLPVLPLLQLQPWVDPAYVLIALAVAAVMWGGGHGLLHTNDYRLQIAGMIGFGTLAWLGLTIDVDVAKYVVVAGFLGHAAWDWVHLTRNRVVDPTYAEFCQAIDVMAAVALAVLPLGVL
jgi:hypothetical protein